MSLALRPMCALFGAPAALLEQGGHGKSMAAPPSRQAAASCAPATYNS